MALYSEHLVLPYPNCGDPNALVTASKRIAIPVLNPACFNISTPWLAWPRNQLSRVGGVLTGIVTIRAGNQTARILLAIAAPIAAIGK